MSLSSLGQAMGVVIRALGSDETHAVVRETESNGDFSVAYDYATSAPIIVITAQGHDPAATSRILARPSTKSSSR